MRLINTTTYKLSDFTAQEIPLYAILSHTWEDEEVLYHDLEDLEKASKLKGYEKLANFCKEAAQQGFQYAWMDTCCMDKSSSAELSEAVNSMFQWYKNATVCYVYLADFVAIANFDFGFDTAPTPPRWFYRSWTLQELLAPDSVVFYDKHWIDFGTRQSLADWIACFTRIDTDLLIAKYSVSNYSVAQKMSWASSRVATRVEDTAYSLMGLFEVNMPLLYGEGWKAFRRLQEEIIRNSSDQSIFAWKSHHSTRGILASSPVDFTESGQVVRAYRWSHSRGYSLTNNGLAIDLPTCEDHGQEEFLGVLDCHLVGYPWSRLAIILVGEAPSTGTPKPIDIGDTPDPRVWSECWRVSSDTLRSVEVSALKDCTTNSLTISPIWRSPENAARSEMRRATIGISLDHAMGNSGYSVAWSRSGPSRTVPTEETFISYTFRGPSDDYFCVKMGWLVPHGGGLLARVGANHRGVEALRNWVAGSLVGWSTDAKIEAGHRKQWLVRAKVRPTVIGERGVQNIILKLTVSVEPGRTL